MAPKDIINPGLPGFDRYTFSPGVARQGKLFFVSGQTGTNDYGQVVSDDFCDQTRAALEKIRLILESGGASFADVVKSVDYISTDAGYRDTAQVRREVWGGEYPAATGVIITQMLRQIPKIEVDCTAIVPNPLPTLSPVILSACTCRAIRNGRLPQASCARAIYCVLPGRQPQMRTVTW